MVTSLILGVCLLGCDLQTRHVEKSVQVGWHNEFESFRTWEPLSMENKANVASLTKGTVHLWLEHVPDGWPYTYQWSGVGLETWIDVAKYPVLMARATQVQGYVHLDVDLYDLDGNVARTLRSNTLTTAGITSIDLGKDLEPKNYRIKIKLIVGGENTGCSATYDWIRTVATKDVKFFMEHPEFKNVRSTSRTKKSR